MRITTHTRVPILLASALALGALAAAGCARSREATKPTPQDPTAVVIVDEHRGAPLFAEHCALCHGARGRGDGPAAESLFPPPRDFGHGRFQLVSTANGAPSDDDLVRLLRRGMPGSSMPPYDWMSASELGALAREVRALAIRGLQDDLVARASEAGELPDADEALAIAVERLTPGATIDPGEPAEATEDVLARGRKAYLQRCAVCHGMEGSGRGREPRWNAKGELEWARDFRSGILKGEATHDALTWRIGAGMPGSTMPATKFADADELAAVVVYVASLMPPGAGEILVRRREEIVADAVAAVPAEPDDPAWAKVAPTRVVLAPNAWRDDSILELDVRALHDAEALALHVSWEDPTRNDRAEGEFELSDGLSVLLTDGSEIPPYGMGSPARPLELWHWKAFRLTDVAGVLELLERAPHGSVDPLAAESVTDVPLYLPAPGLAGPLENAGASLVEGFESARHFASETLGIRAAPRWVDGRWELVLSRSLAPGVTPEDRAPLGLAPGRTYQLALAAWNGAARDRGAQKSVSVWHALRLAGDSPAR